MSLAVKNPVVHLELRTDDLPRACAFYTRLFGWTAESVRVGPGLYISLILGEGIEGGVVEREIERPVWLPYVEVPDIARCHRAGPPARRGRAARAARGPGGLAQRPGAAGRSRDRALAAEGLT